ncbi:DUF4870 domain-containing protein [Chloroflexota bacterium]
MEKTSTGLAENVAGLLCYVLGWISGIVFLIIEPQNKFVRFHAFQSIIVFGIITLIGIVFSPIPFLGGFITWIASVIGFILWILLMVMAAQGKKYKLPWAGDLAEKWAG